jgi:hypothetical protein
MADPYQSGKAAYTANHGIPKMSNHADQQKANAGWNHAKQGK